MKKHTGENVVRIEAEALRALADRIGGPMAEAFASAVELMYGCAGRVVVSVNFTSEKQTVNLTGPE